MADTSVVVQMSAQDAEMVAAWQRARKGPQGMQDELDKVRKKGKTATNDLAAGFQQVAQAAVGIATPIGAALALTKVFRAEFDAAIQRTKEAQGKQIDVNSAFRRAANVAGTIRPNDLYERVVRGANSVDPGELFQVFEAATSAAGNMPREKVLDLVLETAKQRNDLDQESRSNLVTGALQLQKEFGGTSQQAVAAVQQSYGTSRAESLSSFSKNAVPTAVALHQMGSGKDTFEDVMGMVAGFGLASNDPTGERTKTNLISLIKQVKERTVGGKLVAQDASLKEMFAALRLNPRRPSTC